MNLPLGKGCQEVDEYTQIAKLEGQEINEMPSLQNEHIFLHRFADQKDTCQDAQQDGDGTIRCFAYIYADRDQHKDDRCQHKEMFRTKMLVVIHKMIITNRKPVIESK